MQGHQNGPCSLRACQQVAPPSDSEVIGRFWWKFWSCSLSSYRSKLYHVTSESSKCHIDTLALEHSVAALKVCDVLESLVTDFGGVPSESHGQDCSLRSLPSSVILFLQTCTRTFWETCKGSNVLGVWSLRRLVE
eukprot:1369644-Amphidinium_carterae.1